MQSKSTSLPHWQGFAQTDLISLRHKNIMRQMIKTIVEYDLIQSDDHIMIAISGGKDSYTLLDLLLTAQKRAPFEFKITAVHLDQMQPGYDGRGLADWLLKYNIDHKIIKEDTYKIVVEKTKPGGTYCALCSRLRRGILYRVAGEIGANKIALGHHREDSLETFLLNFIYSGKLQAMPAKYLTDDEKFFVIRPMIEISEKDIISYASKKDFAIIPCNLCNNQEGLKREKMKDLILSLEKEKPDIRSVMHNALKNVVATHLLDKDLIGKII